MQYASLSFFKMEAENKVIIHLGKFQDEWRGIISAGSLFPFDAPCAWASEHWNATSNVQAQHLCIKSILLTYINNLMLPSDEYDNPMPYDALTILNAAVYRGKWN
jgi:hypothetical protein